MKILLSIAFLVIAGKVTSQSIPVDSIIQRSSLFNTISVLAHDSMRGRATGSRAELKAANFIAERFKETGLKPVAGNDGFFAFFPFKIFDTVQVYGINVMGALKGNESADSIVIFSAHYDHVGMGQSESKDSVFNGANDNASGVATIIELAKYYSATKNNKYTILFMAFSGEELGLLGSAYASSQINPAYFKAVINFDMVGRPMPDDNAHCMVIAESAKPVLKKLNDQLHLARNFFVGDRYPEMYLYQRSDHYSFRAVKNSFSIMCSSPTDQYYHTVQDETSTIDFGFLLKAVRKIAVACEVFIK